MRPYTLRSQRVVTSTGIVPAAVTVADGRITAVTPAAQHVADRTDIDLGAAALLPGMVDLDARVDGPESRLVDGYVELTTAAARGGVTTVVVAPAPTKPAVLDPVALRTHLWAATQGAWTHVAHLGGVTQHSSPADLAELHAGGVLGLYASLADGGAPDMLPVADTHLHKAMAEAATLDLPILVHAEDDIECGEHEQGNDPSGRPPRAERRGLERVISAARITGARVHVTPFTAAECAALLAASRALGLRVSAQTNPHYLCLPAEHVADSGHSLGCRPPLRSDANRAALWHALLSVNAEAEPSGLTTVGSGHRPGVGLHTIEWMLPALWTAARRRGQTLVELCRWSAQRPAMLVGLGGCKGRIAPGYDADLVAFVPEEPCPVPSGSSPLYAGRQLRGTVAATWVSGRRVP